MPIYDGSDPNGIRTRVTAVKGRCPRPLDDRVGSAGNIGVGVVDARQIGECFWSVHAEGGAQRRGYKLRSATSLAARAVAP
jgi:hypothetical protein